MTHVGTPPKDEVAGNLIALNELAGIPLSSIIGFRAPFLNFTADTLKLLADAPGGVEVLKKFKLVTYGGAPCPDEVGDMCELHHFS